MTFMPRSMATFATSAPMAPRPMIPRVLPLISGPANWLLPFSTSLPTLSPSSLREGTQAIASEIFREDSSSPATTSSFTAFAFAPGVLNTTMPCSAHLSTGILFTPAPARAMASRLLPNSISCIAAERTMIASGFSGASAMAYFAASRRQVPTLEILLSV